MPRRDGSGPEGLGSRTGRCRGACAGGTSPDSDGSIGGEYGRGQGGFRLHGGPGRGGRFGFYGQGRGFNRNTPPEFDEHTAFFEAELMAEQRYAERKPD